MKMREMILLVKEFHQLEKDINDLQDTAATLEQDIETIKYSVSGEVEIVKPDDINYSRPIYIPMQFVETALQMELDMIDDELKSKEELYKAMENNLYGECKC